MDLTKFVAKAERSLAAVLDRTGGILYSAANTLKAGDIYILGLNPGGNGGPSIGQDLFELLRKEDNAYLDEIWKNKTGSYDRGRAPLQRRLRWLIEALGYDLRNVCASNLVFMKSPDASGIDYPKDADTCWPVHEIILDVVRPKLVLAFGTSAVSPFAYLKQRFKGNIETIPSGHGSWRCRGFEAEIAELNCYVAGIPHLSRYSPIDKNDVVNWLKSKIKT